MRDELLPLNPVLAHAEFPVRCDTVTIVFVIRIESETDSKSRQANQSHVRTLWLGQDKTWLRSSATDVTVVKSRREQLYNWTKTALCLCPRAVALQAFFRPPAVGALAVPTPTAHAVLPAAAAAAADGAAVSGGAKSAVGTQAAAAAPSASAPPAHLVADIEATGGAGAAAISEGVPPQPAD